jgi:hypothetical protein
VRLAYGMSNPKCQPGLIVRCCLQPYNCTALQCSGAACSASCEIESSLSGEMETYVQKNNSHPCALAAQTLSSLVGMQLSSPLCCEHLVVQHHAFPKKFVDLLGGQHS